MGHLDISLWLIFRQQLDLLEKNIISNSAHFNCYFPFSNNVFENAKVLVFLLKSSEKEMSRILFGHECVSIVSSSAKLLKPFKGECNTVDAAPKSGGKAPLLAIRINVFFSFVNRCIICVFMNKCIGP